MHMYSTCKELPKLYSGYVGISETRYVHSSGSHTLHYFSRGLCLILVKLQPTTKSQLGLTFFFSRCQILEQFMEC